MNLQRKTRGFIGRTIVQSMYLEPGAVIRYLDAGSGRYARSTRLFFPGEMWGRNTTYVGDVAGGKLWFAVRLEEDLYIQRYGKNITTTPVEYPLKDDPDVHNESVLRCLRVSADRTEAAVMFECEELTDENGEYGPGAVIILVVDLKSAERPLPIKRTLRFGNDEKQLVAFSFDGPCVYRRPDPGGLEVVWAGRPPWTVPRGGAPRSGSPAGAALSRDNKLLALRGKHGMEVVSLESRATLWEDDAADVDHSVFSGDGRWLAACSGEGVLTIRRAATGAVVQREDLFKGRKSVYEVAISDDGSHVAAWNTAGSMYSAETDASHAGKIVRAWRRRRDVWLHERVELTVGGEWMAGPRAALMDLQRAMADGSQPEEKIEE